MYKKLVVLPLIALLIGCASQKKLENESLLPEIDVVQVKENSDQALKLSQEIKLDVDALSTKVTENDNKITTLSDEVSSVSTAKIEEIENRLSLLIEAFKDMQAQIKNLQTASIRTPKAASSDASSGSATFSPSSVTLGTAEVDLYNTGLRTFNDHNYKDAMRIFNDVITKFPSGEYTDNATFWIGECLYSLGDFTAAVKSYEKVLTFKTTSKSDDAMFKLGVTYNKLGQQALAKQQFQNLISRYPASEYVPRAKKYLEGL